MPFMNPAVDYHSPFSTLSLTARPHYFSYSSLDTLVPRTNLPPTSRSDLKQPRSLAPAAPYADIYEGLFFFLGLKSYGYSLDQGYPELNPSRLPEEKKGLGPEFEDHLEAHEQVSNAAIIHKRLAQGACREIGKVHHKGYPADALGFRTPNSLIDIYCNVMKKPFKDTSYMNLAEAFHAALGSHIPTKCQQDQVTRKDMLSDLKHADDLASKNAQPDGKISGIELSDLQQILRGSLRFMILERFCINNVRDQENSKLEPLNVLRWVRKIMSSVFPRSEAFEGTTANVIHTAAFIVLLHHQLAQITWKHFPPKGLLRPFAPMTSSTPSLQYSRSKRPSTSSPRVPQLKYFGPLYSNLPSVKEVEIYKFLDRTCKSLKVTTISALEKLKPANMEKEIKKIRSFYTAFCADLSKGEKKWHLLADGYHWGYSEAEVNQDKRGKARKRLMMETMMGWTYKVRLLLLIRHFLPLIWENNSQDKDWSAYIDQAARQTRDLITGLHIQSVAYGFPDFPEHQLKMYKAMGDSVTNFPFGTSGRLSEPHAVDYLSLSDKEADDTEKKMAQSYRRGLKMTWARLTRWVRHPFSLKNREKTWVKRCQAQLIKVALEAITWITYPHTSLSVKKVIQTYARFSMRIKALLLESHARKPLAVSPENMSLKDLWSNLVSSI
ncbi:MAG: hypothetical protein DHS80DRAFT_25444 [Piptocephalis tieghemiana]|nr:MAG: hypothetical protein DHS80DRAFT_25444 [Piptocephalis tieghemiana]